MSGGFGLLALCEAALGDKAPLEAAKSAVSNLWPDHHSILSDDSGALTLKRNDIGRCGSAGNRAGRCGHARCWQDPTRGKHRFTMSAESRALFQTEC